MSLWATLKKWLGREDGIDPDMKFLIVGLGNMGPDYEGTRHNVGFAVVDKLAEEEGVSWTHENLGDLGHFKTRGKHVYLLKPSTYMNLSGKAVRYWVQKLQIKSGHWLVVVDEFQFDVGTMKLLKKGSAGGHNGLQSIQDLMQTSQYPRLRVGIGHDFHRGQQVDYVLGKWSEEQLKLLPQILDQAVAVIRSFVVVGLDRSMNLHNKRK